MRDPARAPPQFSRPVPPLLTARPLPYAQRGQLGTLWKDLPTLPADDSAADNPAYVELSLRAPSPPIRMLYIYLLFSLSLPLFF